MSAPDAAEPTRTARSVRNLLAETADVLAAAGVSEASVEAELLLGHVLEVSRGRVQFLAVMGEELGLDDTSRLQRLLERRAAREPLQHITGRAPFRSIELEVGPGVFIPRPETEVVAQFAIDALWASAGREPIAVDFGTGTGALALSLATEVPHARIWAVEKSPEAFVYTQRNIARIGAPNITAVRGDLTDALAELNGQVSVVVSNPPYIPRGAIPRDIEVREFDPPEALYAGDDGLDVVRALSVRARALLHPGGTLILEHGELQGAAVRQVLTADLWRAVATHPDLTTRDRVAIALR